MRRSTWFVCHLHALTVLIILKPLWDLIPVIPIILLSLLRGLVSVTPTSYLSNAAMLPCECAFPSSCRLPLTCLFVALIIIPQALMRAGTYLCKPLMVLIIIPALLLVFIVLRTTGPYLSSTHSSLAVMLPCECASPPSFFATNVCSQWLQFSSSLLELSWQQYRSWF